MPRLKFIATAAHNPKLGKPKPGPDIQMEASKRSPPVRDREENRESGPYVPPPLPPKQVMLEKFPDVPKRASKATYLKMLPVKNSPPLSRRLVTNKRKQQLNFDSISSPWPGKVKIVDWQPLRAHIRNKGLLPVALEGGYMML